MFVEGYKLLEDPTVIENVIVGTMIQAYKDGRNALLEKRKPNFEKKWLP